jgi:pimeloyl-ACP methyl ester carboxylesterase
MKLSTLSTVLLLAMLAGGCADISPGKLSEIQPISDSQVRVGNAYLFRGFIGVFSTGMNSLGEQLNDTGVRARVFQADQWADVADTIAVRYASSAKREPVVLVGHSYGADNILHIAQRLKDKNVKVDLIITLDPVTPPKVPSNVVKVVNLYQPNGAWDKMPWLRGIPLEEEEPGQVKLLNENIREGRKDLLEDGLNHFNIEKKKKIHQEIITQIKQICVTRQEWASRNGPSVPAAPAPVYQAAHAAPLKEEARAVRAQ